MFKAVGDHPMLSGAGTPSAGWCTSRRLLLSLALALFGLAALSCDLPIARWFREGRCPADLMRVFALAEVYAHGFGVTAIMIAVIVLDSRREMVPRAIAIVAGGGLSADLLKLLLVRTRPKAFSLTGSVWDTFGHWFPLPGACAEQSRKFSLGAHGDGGGIDRGIGDLALPARALDVCRVRGTGRLPADGKRLALSQRRGLGRGDWHRASRLAADAAGRSAGPVVRAIGRAAAIAPRCKNRRRSEQFHQRRSAASRGRFIDGLRDGS